MIPTLLLVGFALGRWWRAAVPIGAIGWAVLLIATGVDEGLTFALGAASLAAVNLAVGALAFQGCLIVFRRTRSGSVES